VSLLEVLFKIIIVTVLCSIIGIERGIRHKGAGLRTHLLVGLGSALIVLTSLYLYEVYSNETPIDPTRMMADLITGIGFLCAGTIMRAGSQVTGLTTAASLWIVSCIGIAVASGYYIASLIVSVLIFIILTRARSIEERLERRIHSTFKVEEEGGE